MSITVTAVKARQNLGELLNLVSIKHEEIIIERAGKKIARLTFIDEGAGAVSEPVAEAYAVKKKEVRKEPIDFSSIFGTWDDEEYRKVTEAVNSLRTIDPEHQALEEFRKVRGMRMKAPLADIPEGAVPQQPNILDLCGLGKEMWESTGLTPDEYVRKEREEWD